MAIHAPQRKTPTICDNSIPRVSACILNTLTKQIEKKFSLEQDVNINNLWFFCSATLRIIIFRVMNISVSPGHELGSERLFMFSSPSSFFMPAYYINSDLTTLPCSSVHPKVTHTNTVPVIFSVSLVVYFSPAQPHLLRVWPLSLCILK